MSNGFVGWWKMREARRAAKKYNLDFCHLCCFQHQVTGVGRGVKWGNGEIAKVPMQSGKTGLYKVTSKRFSFASEDTGQRNWYFKFQGYAG